MPTIVFLDRYSLFDTDTSVFQTLGEYTEYEQTDPSLVLERCALADVVITNKVVFSQEILSRLPGLKLLCIAATGTNNVDTDAAQRMGISVKNVVGYSTDSVAETTFALALELIRNTSSHHRYVTSGAYGQSGRFVFMDGSIGQIKGSEWGIIGLGNIGKRVAEIALSFGAKVSYFSTSGKNQNQHYRQKSLEELLRESDIISIHAPLNEKTKNLIGKKELAIMKNSGRIINVGRGGIVDEKELSEALINNTIAGAALDVFEKEPLDPSHVLLTVPAGKIVFSPHNAWGSFQAREELVKQIVRHITTMPDNP